MVSPYIEAAATRAGIGHKAAPTPRTQSEAGIDMLEWESRQRPLPRSWLDIIGYALGGAALPVGLLLIFWSGV